MEDLEGKAESDKDTGVFELINGECSCGGQLSYVIGEGRYRCRECHHLYDPKDVLK